MKPAQLFDHTSQLIGHCTNSPDAIAKAALEHPEVRFFKAWGFGGMRHISALTSDMHNGNEAISNYVAMPGVVPAIDTFDPADIIDN